MNLRNFQLDSNGIYVKTFSGCAHVEGVVWQHPCTVSVVAKMGSKFGELDHSNPVAPLLCAVKDKVSPGQTIRVSAAKFTSLPGLGAHIRSVQDRAEQPLLDFHGITCGHRRGDHRGWVQHIQGRVKRHRCPLIRCAKIKSSRIQLNRIAGTDFEGNRNGILDNTESPVANLPYPDIH